MPPNNGGSNGKGDGSWDYTVVYGLAGFRGLVCRESGLGIVHLSPAFSKDDNPPPLAGLLLRKLNKFL